MATGDSRGYVQIWNVQKRLMLNLFKAHEADVLTLSVFSYIDAQTEGKRVLTTLLVSGGVDAKLCVFSHHEEEGTEENEGWWIHAATYRSHTHDILCSTMHLLTHNASALFLTSKTSNLRHQLAFLAEKAAAPASSEAPEAPEAPEASQKPSAESSSDLPELRPLNEDLAMLAIISGGVDGNLIVYNLQGRLESLTLRLYGYPSFYCPVVATQPSHCLLQVALRWFFRCSSTTASS